jgi:TonB family protein
MNMPYWFSNLAYWSAQVALLVLAAGFLPHIFKIRQPRVLLIYWRALIAAALLLPFVQPWHRPESFTTMNFAPRTDEFTSIIIGAPVPAVSHWYLPSAQIIAAIVGLIILAGIAVRFIILALGLVKLRQFRRASSPISSHAESETVLDEMRARVNTTGEFRISSDVESPVTFGLAAPVILLPERFPTLDAQYQSTIACHELLHVRRRDWAHHLSEEILRAALWFHPAIAWLISRIRLSREQVVDLEVINLTGARKPYLEALLEFTNSRALATAIPAPPFLVERQLAERVALMLKEVRMSRTRLIASLTAFAACLALVATLAIWTFPLKASPKISLPPVRTYEKRVMKFVPGGIIGGVSDGVTIGVTGGIVGGINQGVSGGITSNAPVQGVRGGVTGGVKSTDSVALADSWAGPTPRDSGALVGPAITSKLPTGVAGPPQQPGPKIIVTDIKFVGEVHDADAVRSRILKGLEGHVWDGSNNQWLNEIAEVDVRGDLQNHGYFEVNVDGIKSQVVDSTPTQQRVVASFHVTEGDQFRAGDLTFVGFDPARGPVIPVSDLRAQFHLQTGDLLNVDELRHGIEGISRLYGARGYMDFEARPRFTIDRQGHTIAMALTLTEGSQYRVASFVVHGLDSATTANLESKIRPGTIYDNSLTQDLFNQGNAVSGANIRWVDGIHLKRNVDARTVDISFDFPVNQPSSPAASNAGDSRFIGRFQYIPPAVASSGKFQNIPPAGICVGSFQTVARSDSPDPCNRISQSTNDANGGSTPVCKYCPRPEYSAEARSAKLMGTVHLEVTVLANGRAGEVKLTQGIGSGLDENAIDAVKNQWIFKPAVGPNGAPVDATVPVEVIFQLYPEANGVSAPFCESCPKPEYSSQARSARLTGTVYLDVTVLPNGRAGEVKLTKGIGMGLDEKAIDIVKKKWKFKPAIGPNGKPVKAVVPIEIKFDLY